MCGLSASQALANSNSIRCDTVIQARRKNLPMSDRFRLTEARLKRMGASFPRRVTFRATCFPAESQLR
jgi:hypothetical protein